MRPDRLAGHAKVDCNMEPPAGIPSVHRMQPRNALAPERADDVTERSEMDELVRRAQRGDVAAFERIYRQHVGRIYALCLRMAGNATRAQELTQDVFVRAWERLDSFRGESAVGSWLHRMAVNIVLQHARSDRRRQARVETVEDVTVFDVAGRSAPDAVLDLEAAIAGLPPGARAAFVLHEVEGFSHDEIASQLGVAAGTVRAQLHRARQLLMKALDR